MSKFTPADLIIVNENGYTIRIDGAENILVGYTGPETDLVLPYYITKIKQFAFRADRLTSVVIPDSVTSIDDYTFYDCKSLTSVVIGDSVTSIGAEAFYDCYKLVEVVNKSTHFTVKKGSCDYGRLGRYALAVYNSGDAYISKLSNDNGYIIYTDGAEKILVSYNGTETDLVLPSYITKINQYAFFRCDSLTSVVIPDSVTSIDDYTFQDCRSLTSVVIGDGVTSIGAKAFYDCYKLVEVVNKSTHFTVTKGSYTNGYVGDYALAVYNSGSGITESQLLNDNGYIICTDGVEKILVGYKGAGTDVVLPSYITKINQDAFAWCDSLTSVVIGDSVTSIDSAAFYNCNSLTSVVIGDSVTSIGHSAFGSCTSLTSVVIGDGVTNIGERAFYACGKLTSIVIGESVTSINDYAFFSCPSLTSVYYKGTSESWQNISLGNITGNLMTATRYYYSETKPTASGNYWHYDQNGNPVAW